MWPHLWYGLTPEPFSATTCLFLQSGLRGPRYEQGRPDSLARHLLSDIANCADRLSPTVRLGVRESFTVIREASNVTLPLSGVVGNPQTRANYLSSIPSTGRESIASPLDKITPIESVEAEISRLTWAVIDGIATPADRERLSELVNEQHAFRRA